MTDTNTKPRMARPAAIAPVLAVSLAGLALAGCAGTHVGDSWQCPIAQGAVCTSVADADPAVPRTEPADRLALRKPLHEPRGTPANALSAIPENPPGAARDTRPCETACGPLAWLARLFAADGGEKDRGAARGDGAGPAGVTPLPLPALYRAAPDNAARDRAADDGPPDDGLREAEVIGRVWIGPFVDAGGIYREAAYVRVVIAPARWRRP